MAEIIRTTKNTETIRVKGDTYMASFTVDAGICHSVMISYLDGRPVSGGMGSVPAQTFPDLVDVIGRTYETLSELAVGGGEVEGTDIPYEVR